MEDGDELFTFHDSNPAAPHHLLVLPKHLIQDASTLTPADVPLVRRMRRKALELMRAAVAEADGEAAFDEEELLLGFHMPPAYSVAWLHLHAIYPRLRLRRPWKYTPLSFKSPEWVVERLERQVIAFRPPNER